MIGVAMILSIRAVTIAFDHDIRSWIDVYIGGDLFVFSSIPMRNDLQAKIAAVPGVAEVASVGGFENRGTFGNDRAAFAGLSLESQLTKGLHLSAWVRQGDTVASLTKLDQKTVYGFASLEYRLRQFNLAAEYRNSQQSLMTSDLTEPYSFRGHQVLLRLSRKFGKRV